MSEQMKITGVLKEVMETKTFDSGFKKREFVVTVIDGKYDQDICFELLADHVDMIENFTIAGEITVLFNIRGREYNGRYFNNLVAWKMEGDTSGKKDDMPEKYEPKIENKETTTLAGDDDLPF